MITISQCRAARGLLGWTQQDLADASGLSKTAINNFEKGHSDIKKESLKAIRTAFESADIEFLGQEGLRKKTEKAQLLSGPLAVSELLDDIHKTMENEDGDILIVQPDESLTADIEAQKLLEHLERMKKLGIKQRALCGENRPTMLVPFENIRWLPQNSEGHERTICIYGDRLALKIWGQDVIVIISSRETSRTERIRFEHLWSAAQIPQRQKNFSQKTA